VHAQPRAFDVHAVLRAQILDRGFEKAAREHDAGVVHQHVEAAAARAQLVVRRAPVLGARHVVAQREVPRALEPPRGVLRGARVEIAAHDPRAEARERLAAGAADAGARARHERDAAFQVEERVTRQG